MIIIYLFNGDVDRLNDGVYDDYFLLKLINI